MGWANAECAFKLAPAQHYHAAGRARYRLVASALARVVHPQAHRKEEPCHLSRMPEWMSRLHLSEQPPSHCVPVARTTARAWPARATRFSTSMSFRSNSPFLALAQVESAVNDREEVQFVSLTPWSGDVVIEVEAEPALGTPRERAQGKGRDVTVVGKEQMSHLGESLAKPGDCGSLGNCATPRARKRIAKRAERQERPF